MLFASLVAADYPCPLVSVRQRKPVYGEIGHTIMNLLADFRNYQYTLTCVRGVRVHMQDQRTSVLLPRNRYDEVGRGRGGAGSGALGATMR